MQGVNSTVTLAIRVHRRSPTCLQRLTSPTVSQVQVWKNANLLCIISHLCCCRGRVKLQLQWIIWRRIWLGGPKTSSLREQCLHLCSLVAMEHGLTRESNVGKRGRLSNTREHQAPEPSLTCMRSCPPGRFSRQIVRCVISVHLITTFRANCKKCFASVRRTCNRGGIQAGICHA